MPSSEPVGENQAAGDDEVAADGYTGADTGARTVFIAGTAEPESREPAIGGGRP